MRYKLFLLLITAPILVSPYYFFWQDHPIFWDAASTEGTVLHHDLKKKQLTGGRATGYALVNQIHFRYSVNGKIFIGDRIRRTSVMSEEQLLADMATFVPGRPVKVWYNKNQPSEAVLDTSVAADAIWTTTLIFFFVPGSILIFWRAIDKQEKRRRINRKWSDFR